MHPSIAKAREERFQSLVGEIRRRCEELVDGRGAESAYLFGSYARGDFSGASDVDLLVFLTQPDARLAMAIKESLSHLAEDVLVTTWEEYRRHLADSFFWRQVDADRTEVWRREHG